MILGDLKRLLSQLDSLPNDAEIIFTPYEACCGGYPEWTDCTIHEQDTEADKRLVLKITLRGEME